MKKRLLIVLTILIVATFSISLTACSGSTVNYDGKATITFNFDDVYPSINISCPTGKVTKVDDKTIKCELSTLRPVKIFATAEGNDTQIFDFTTEELKKGELSRTVSFKDQKYRMTFNVALQDDDPLPKVVGDESITIEKLATGKYDIISNSKITKDIKLDIGEDYFYITIPKEKFVYSLGIYGTISDNLEMLKKADNKAKIYIDCESLELRKIKGADRTIDLYSNGNQGTTIDIDDYYILDRGNAVGKISKAELLANPYYYYKSPKAAALDVVLPDEYSVSYINGFDRYVSQQRDRDNNDKVSITSNRPFVAGTILQVEIYKKGHGSYVEGMYVLTDEDIASKKVNITLDKIERIKISDFHTIEYPEGEQEYIFHYVDEKGNKVDATYDYVFHDGYEGESGWVNTTTRTTIKDGEVVKLKHNGHKSIGFELSESSKTKCKTIKYYTDYYGGGVDIEKYLYIYRLLNKDKQGPIDVYLTLAPSYEVKIKIIDKYTKEHLNKDEISTKEFFDGERTSINYTDFGNPDKPNSKDIYYKIVDDRVGKEDSYFIYDRKLYEGQTELVFEAERLYDFEVVVDNIEVLNGGGRNDYFFRYGNSFIHIKPGYVDKPGEQSNANKFECTKSDFDKVIECNLDEYEALRMGYSKVSFELTIPKEYPKDGIIHVKIETIKDEWGIVDRY